MNAAHFSLKPFLGKRQFLPIFKGMYKVGLAGMNVGEGGMPKQSVEPWVLNFVCSRLAKRTQAPVVFDVLLGNLLKPFWILLDHDFGCGVLRRATLHLNCFSGSLWIARMSPRNTTWN